MDTTEIDDFLLFFHEKVNKLDRTTAEDEVYKYYSNSSSDEKLKKNSEIVVKKNIVFDRGWYYAQRFDTLFQSTGKYLLTKGSDCISVAPHEFVEDNELSNGYGKDGNCYVKVQIHQFFTSGSWNWVNGNNYLGDFNTLRIYFSFHKHKKKRLTKFIKQVKEVLDQKDIPFSLKFENELSQRNENGVLYFQRSDYFPVFVIITTIYRDFDDIFRNSAMPFVKKFSSYPGVFFAESPTQITSSFGTSLSQTFVKILFGKEGMTGNEFMDGLKKEGLTYDKLYLNPNTNFPYSFIPFEVCSKDNTDFALDYVMLRFDINMLVTSKMINIIIRNLYVTLDKDFDTQFRIFEGQKQDEGLKFVFAPDLILQEILDVLKRYNWLLIKRYDLSDDYVNIFIGHLNGQKNGKLLTDKLGHLNVELFKAGGDTNNPEVFNPLAKSNEFDKESNELIDKIKRNLEERGIISYLPDDEFVCSYDNRGYNYILKNLLVKMEKAYERRSILQY